MGKNLNGSVDILADAMRKVFSEAVGGAVEPLEQQLDALDQRLGNVENAVNDIPKMLDEQRKAINADMRDALEKR